MNKYFNSYRKMISLRGLTDHTIKGYCVSLLDGFKIPVLFQIVP